MPMTLVNYAVAMMYTSIDENFVHLSTHFWPALS
jgi:hypothetical protein